MTDLKALVRDKSTVLFDMDGTLVNTEPLHAQAATVVLAELGIHVEMASIIDNFYGVADTEVLKKICPTMSDDEINKAIEQKNFQLINLFKNLADHEKEKFITPGLFPFLQYLKDENKTCAVVSASEDIIVHETLKCFGIDSFMSLQMGRNQTPRTKPHPDPYLEAMRRLGGHHNHTIIFEDSPTGIKSAVATDAKVVRVMTFIHPHSPQSIHGDFTEILNFHTKP